jgi:putative transposase
MTFLAWTSASIHWPSGLSGPLGHFCSRPASGLYLVKTSYARKMNASRNAKFDGSDKILAMIVSLRNLLGWLVSAFSSREDLVLENLALRRQLLALHAQRPRPRLTAWHKLFWVGLRALWSGWRKPLVLVTPRTVVNWHRAGFRLYWTWIARVRRLGGRECVSKEIRLLIFRMVAENATCGAPRIHGELLKLGFDVSERSVSRWI